MKTLRRRKKLFIEKQRQIIFNLKEVFRAYLDGVPSEAYDLFKKAVIDNDLENELVNFRTIILDKDKCLYRVKKEYSPKDSKFVGKGNGLGLIEPLEMFHVPFEKRRAVGTNRFSIPGFPSLYLSDELYTSWSECLSEQTEAFHAVCFKNHRPLYLADLVPLDFALSKRIDPSIAAAVYGSTDLIHVLTNYATIYPLILACHSKIKYVAEYPGEIIFKSEYIVPQLLLQWYREKKLMIDGIRYLSCTAQEKFPLKDFNKFNYVLPAVGYQEEGCNRQLLINFSSSKVYSYINPLTTHSVDYTIETIVDQLKAQTFIPLISK